MPDKKVEKACRATQWRSLWRITRRTELLNGGVCGESLGGEQLQVEQGR